MSLSFAVLVDAADVEKFTAYLDGMGRRASRAELLPILTEHFEPLVASEKAFLSSHSESGALEASLAARSGKGDRPGTLSVFAAPTALSKQLAAHWSKGRGQQRRWAAGLKPKGRRMVFYADFVEKGHRIVRVNKAGQEYEVGRAKPVPFARQAAESLGEAQSEKAAVAVLNHIAGE